MFQHLNFSQFANLSWTASSYFVTCPLNMISVSFRRAAWSFLGFFFLVGNFSKLFLKMVGQVVNTIAVEDEKCTPDWLTGKQDFYYAPVYQPSLLIRFLQQLFSGEEDSTGRTTDLICSGSSCVFIPLLNRCNVSLNCNNKITYKQQPYPTMVPGKAQIFIGLYKKGVKFVLPKIV